MDSVRLVRASLDIEFCIDNSEEHRKEFDRLSEVDDDPIGHWLKIAKAKGLTRDSDPVLLTLVTELHRKIDELKSMISNKEDTKLKLDTKALIKEIGFEHFVIENQELLIGEKYYGRIDMPTFPKRVIPVFFIAQSENLAKVELIHDRDMKDWDAYIAARERVLIREMKAKK